MLNATTLTQSLSAKALGIDIEQANVALDRPTAEKSGDMLHGPIMAILREVSAFALDFLVPIIADNRHALESGKTVLDIAAGENGNDSKNRLNVYRTNVRADDVLALYVKVRKLAALAGRLALANSDANADLIDALTLDAQAAYAELRSLDRALWQVFASEGVQHLTGIEAAHVDRDGTSWTQSLKGRSSTIRNDKSADSYLGANRSEHAYAQAPSAYLSERDIAELMAA